MEIREHKYENIYKPGEVVKFPSNEYYVVEKNDANAYVFKKIDDICKYMEEHKDD